MGVTSAHNSTAVREAYGHRPTQPHLTARRRVSNFTAQRFQFQHGVCPSLRNLPAVRRHISNFEPCPVGNFDASNNTSMSGGKA
jgi:hypothetical protein